MIKKRIKFIWIFIFVSLHAFSQESTISVEKIMQDPVWMGHFPSEIRWDERGGQIYFKYNLGKDKADSLHKIDIQKTGSVEKLDKSQLDSLITAGGAYNAAKTKKLFVKNGALFLYDIKENSQRKLLELPSVIGNPQFLVNENEIAFELDKNIYVYDQSAGLIDKLTNFHTGEAPKEPSDTLSDNDGWRKNENLSLIGILQERKAEEELTKAYNDQNEKKAKEPFYSDKKNITNIKVSPDGKYVTFNLIDKADNKSTIVPDYVDISGYTENLPTRTKVGSKPDVLEMAVYQVEKDTVRLIDTGDLPGMEDLPDFVKDYPDKDWDTVQRKVNIIGPVFSDNGRSAVVAVRSHDNKDRWIALLDLANGKLKVLDRQRDEAWIGGPGIGSHQSTGTLGWFPDDRHIYFQSEETGFSHLYRLNTEDGTKTALTKGNYEVFDPEISNDKKSWYFTSSEIHSGERHFYRMPLMGGKAEQLTDLTGNNQVHLSPDEKHLAILYSYSNQPWELYLKKNEPDAESLQLTDGQSRDFKAYSWRDPQLVKFRASDGEMVPARLYLPEADKKNNAAILFVHGAGYLQNVHKWWSSYFREYMFHNLLTDLGYTVLDVDYRGSAGYGRDWRTGIYRFMGGKDLSDQMDGIDYLVQEHGIDASKIAIYGGSYGGFITLMALFNHPEKVKSGAALRSVTDWAHYNHGYTSNILNQPADDPIAYQRSSPIYHAEGLQGHLLIAHGMVDINVHFQDVVRLVQRLIELKKDNWELAVYPMEDHGFKEPSSWTDEYKRILKLFNETLLD